MSQPTVSLCIPVYNAEKLINKAINSILTQTYTDFEIIVVDNASTDGTVDVVKSFDDPRISVVVNDENYGPVENFNRAVAATTGKYVKLLCADDELLPTCLAQQVAVFEAAANKDVVLVASRRRVVDEQDNVVMAARGLAGMKGRVAGKSAIRKIVRTGTNPLGEPGAVLVRGDLFRSTLPWSGEFPYMIDVEMWTRLLERGDLFAIREPLFVFRVGNGSWSHELTKKQSAQAIAFLQTVGRRLPQTVSHSDVRIGSLRAQFLARGRRVVYSWLNFKQKRTDRKSQESHMLTKSN